MTWLWPGLLFLLLLIPVVVGIYIWTLRRRRRFAVRYSSLSLVRQALPQHSLLRRHLPFALFGLALTSLVFALGRPAAVVSVPTGRATIILSIDVSLSMCQTDIRPNRLAAAQAAALQFIQDQEAGTQIGIVAFAGFAELVQPPTTDRRALETAVKSLYTARRTAIGEGILEGLDAIAEVDPNVAPSTGSLSSSSSSSGLEPTPVPQGLYAPAVIVLLTDGASNAGMMPLDAAREAADRGVRVYTIGFGTANPSGGIPFCGGPFDNNQFDSDQFGGGFGFGVGAGGRFRRGIDEETLKQVADMTGGEYFSAESARELQQVFKSLPTHTITRHELMEVSVGFTALGALLAVAAIGLSLLWHPLP